MGRADAKFQVKSPEWWKHLRPFNKRRFWKALRRISKMMVTSDEHRTD